MTDKERAKLKIDEFDYDNEHLFLPVSEKDTAKMLAKELRKSLAKKGYWVEKDELFSEKKRIVPDLGYRVVYILNGFIEDFEVTHALRKTWAENDLSVLKTAKEDKEFKKFTKAVKKHLKEEKRYEELEPKEEREI